MILADGGDAPIKNALEIPSNGISDDGSRMMAVVSLYGQRFSFGVSRKELCSEREL